MRFFKPRKKKGIKKERQQINRDEAAEARVVEAGTGELQSGERIEFSSGELIPRRESRVRRVPKGIIARLCCQRTRSNA